jgi:hypothetical protein
VRGASADVSARLARKSSIAGPQSVAYLRAHRASLAQPDGPSSPVHRRASVGIDAHSNALFFNDLGSIDLTRSTHKDKGRPRRRAGEDDAPAAANDATHAEKRRVGSSSAAPAPATASASAAPAMMTFTSTAANQAFPALSLPVPEHLLQPDYRYTQANDYHHTRVLPEGPAAGDAGAGVAAQVEDALLLGEARAHTRFTLAVRVACSDVCAACAAAHGGGGAGAGACEHQSVAVYLYARSRGGPAGEASDGAWRAEDQSTEAVCGSGGVFATVLELDYAPVEQREFAFMVAAVNPDPGAGDEPVILGTAAATPEALVQAKTSALPLVDLEGRDTDGVLTLQALTLSY